MHNKSFISLLLLASIGSILLSLTMGSTPLPLSSVWQALFEPATTTSDMIISQLRLPRVLSGFAVGALLALAGT
ncbi:MAG: iron chelate uptake ABC transporter family permease subunit, partial [Thioalkalispiraceae bacterium]